MCFDLENPKCVRDDEQKRYEIKKQLEELIREGKDIPLELKREFAKYGGEMSTLKRI